MGNHTDFAAMTPQRKLAWRKEAYRAYRDQSFIKKFMGSGDNAVIQRITELTKTEKGDKCMIPLIADLVGSGVTGDNQLEGREEAINAYWQEIQIDQLRKATKNKGRMADQRSVLSFRDNARDVVGYWMANTVDELAILTMSGISYALNCDGSTRQVVNGEDLLTDLAFAADVSAPTSKRHYRVSGTALAAGDTTAIAATDVLKYGHMVDLMAEAKTRRIKPLRDGGQEYFVWLAHPKQFAQLKKDPDFRDAVINAGERGKNNPVFTGATLTIDGLVIHTHNKVYNTLGASAGSKWGAGSAINGGRSLLLGAQALGFADLGLPNWEEKEFDYGNKVGIGTDKMFGFLKPKFYSTYDKSTEDFGLMVLDSAIS